MIKVISSFAIMLLTMSGNTAAQTVDAKAIIEKTSQRYKQWQGADIKFTARIHSDKNGMAESFEGTIIMKNDKFILETPDMKTWFDGTVQWSYMPRTGEVNVITPTGSDLQAINPMLLLQHCQNFDVSYIGESTSANAKTAHDIALVPGKKDDIEKIELQIEKSTSLPVKLVVTMRNGLRTTLHVKEIKETARADSIFSFPKSEYPDAEIIDLR